MVCYAVLLTPQKPQADKNEEEDLLIYNWKPEYTGRHESGEEEQDFQQTYIFATGADKKHSSSVAAAAKGLLQRWLSWA